MDINQLSMALFVYNREAILQRDKSYSANSKRNKRRIQLTRTSMYALIHKVLIKGYHKGIATINGRFTKEIKGNNLIYKDAKTNDILSKNTYYFNTDETYYNKADETKILGNYITEKEIATVKTHEFYSVIFGGFAYMLPCNILVGVDESNLKKMDTVTENVKANTELALDMSIEEAKHILMEYLQEI